MAAYLVDYENVSYTGLDGISKLTTKDEIIIFYSENASVINIDYLTHCKAHITYIKVGCGTPNALDFQLVGYLFFHMKKKGVYIIVSKDTGYDVLIETAKNYGATVIRRASLLEYFMLDVEADRTLANDVEKEIKEDLASKTVPKTSFKVVDIRALTNLSEDCADKMKNLIREKTGVKPSEEVVQMVITGIRTSPGKQEFYRFCINTFGQNVGHNLYKKLRGTFEPMKTLVNAAS